MLTTEQALEVFRRANPLKKQQEASNRALDWLRGLQNDQPSIARQQAAMMGAVHGIAPLSFPFQCLGSSLGGCCPYCGR